MEKPILYVNACVRKESRTKILAEQLLLKLGKSFEEIKLGNIDFSRVSEEYLNKRDELCTKGNYQDSMFDLARQFSEAEIIVIAAPFWDLSFPALLKQYLEQINVVGITFKYSEEGIPVGLCKANRLFYVTTAGGNYVPEEYGFGYIKSLAQNYYGIQNVQQITAVGLDINGADVATIMRTAKDTLSEIDLSQQVPINEDYKKSNLLIPCMISLYKGNLL